MAAGDAQNRDSWRRAAIFAIKLVHSIIFLANSAAIFHIFYAGVTNRRSRWTAPAVMLTFIESGIFVAKRGGCPLTDLVEDLGAESGHVFDIFLPSWFADHIPQLFTPPLIIGVLTLVFHDWRAGQRAASPGGDGGVGSAPASPA